MLGDPNKGPLAALRRFPSQSYRSYQ